MNANLFFFIFFPHCKFLHSSTFSFALLSMGTHEAEKYFYAEIH